jgi:hypothetical protein
MIAAADGAFGSILVAARGQLKSSALPAGTPSPMLRTRGGLFAPGYRQMISAVECREHAVECRQMSERAPTLRVRDILIDMARAWERLALETEHNAPATPKQVLRHQFRRGF